MGQCADLTAGVLLMQLNLNVLLVLHGKNEDIARKEAVLAQKQRELRQREREEILEKRRHTEKLRRRARYSLDELGVMFATSGANKNKNVVATGSTNLEVGASGLAHGVEIHGIPLSEI